MTPMNPLTVPRVHFASLSDPRNGSGGRPDWTARVVLYGLLAVTTVSAFLLRWDLDAVGEALVGGFALVAGVLVGVFAQLASWRTRLDDRAAFRPRSEAPARRLVDAAVAHALMGVLASVAGAALAVLIGVGAPGSRIWNALAAGIGVYLLAMFIVIVNTAYAAYRSSIDDATRESDEDLLAAPRPTIAEVDGNLRSVRH